MNHELIEKIKNEILDWLTEDERCNRQINYDNLDDSTDIRSAWFEIENGRPDRAYTYAKGVGADDLAELINQL
jgi:hypothetical protein